MTKNPVIISVDSRELVSAISWSSKGVNRNGSTAAESAVSFQLEGNTLTLKSFDGSGYFESRLQVARGVEDSGENLSLAIHGPLLTSATKILKSGDTRLEFGKDKVVLRTGRSHFSLPTLKVTKIAMPDVASNVGTVLANEFKQAVSQVAIAASGDETLAALTGILIEFRPLSKTLRLVACDRYQLAVRDIEYTPEEGAHDAESTDEVAFKVLVPAKELKKLATGVDAGSILELRASSDNAFFGLSSPSESGYVNVFNEEFVAYDKLMRATYPTRMVVDRAELRSAVSDLSVLIAGHEAIHLHINESLVRVHNAADDSEIEVDALLSNNDVNEDFGFSKEYISGALSSPTSTKISFEFGNSGKPVVVREVDEEENDTTGWYHLIMPRR